MSVGIEVSASMSGGVPFVAEGEVSVGGSFSYDSTDGGSASNTFEETYEFPVTIAARSRMLTTCKLTKTKMDVPYDLLFRSRTAGNLDLI